MRTDNKAKLLELAAAAIDEGGEAALRVHELAAAAGVTVPLIYYYFDSRDGLVAAAQLERYARHLRDDTDKFEEYVKKCETREELREVMLGVWSSTLSERREGRWARINALGSAYGREDLGNAISEVREELFKRIVAVTEPLKERGWLPVDIDVASAVAWHHSLILSRVFVERGATMIDIDRWDKMTLDTLDRLFFG